MTTPITAEHRAGKRTLPAYLRVLAAHLRVHWAAHLALLCAILTFDASFALGVNVTPSLPYTLCLIVKGDLDLRRGDLVAFRWHGGGPYPAGVVFTKLVTGLPGDEVTREDRDFYVGGIPAGRAKPFARNRESLEPGPAGVLPPGRYYLAGTHPDSLDSRYALAGWIPREALIGRAHVLF